MLEYRRRWEAGRNVMPPQVAHINYCCVTSDSGAFTLSCESLYSDQRCTKCNLCGRLE